MRLRSNPPSLDGGVKPTQDRDICQAKALARDARESGLGRESLYKALSPAGDPEFATILKVLAALGLPLHASPARARVAR